MGGSKLSIELTGTAAGATWLGMRVIARSTGGSSGAGWSAKFEDGTPVDWSLPWSKAGSDPNNYVGSGAGGSCVAFGPFAWVVDGVPYVLEPYSWGDIDCPNSCYPLCKRRAGTWEPAEAVSVHYATHSLQPVVQYVPTACCAAWLSTPSCTEAVRGSEPVLPVAHATSTCTCQVHECVVREYETDGSR